MAYAKKIALHCPNGYDTRLDTLIEDFIRDGVVFVGVVGEDCARVEDIIDEVRTGASYRDIAAKFHLEDFEVEALVRPHIRPPAFRKPRLTEPQTEALL